MNPQDTPTPTEETTEHGIPYGYCHCGCGQRTKASKRNNHVRFIYGHHARAKPHEFVIEGDYTRVLFPTPKYPDAEFVIDTEDLDRVLVHHWNMKTSPAAQTLYVQRKDSRTINAGSRKCVLLHRFILGETNPSVLVDHEDGNGMNNRKRNLRRCTQQQNQFNRFAVRGSSRFKGVYWHKPSRKWKAGIRLDGKTRELGSFDSEVAAAAAYNTAASSLYGEFARLNDLTGTGPTIPAALADALCAKGDADE